MYAHYVDKDMREHNQISCKTGSCFVIPVLESPPPPEKTKMFEIICTTSDLILCLYLFNYSLDISLLVIYSTT